MKHIVVRHSDKSVSVYSCGTITKSGNVIDVTEDEETQSCYDSLISDIKRKEFDKNIESLLVNYLGDYTMDEWVSISINVSYINDSKHCQIGVGNNGNALKKHNLKSK